MDPITTIATSLAADAVKQIVKLGGREIRKRFKKETPREKALQNAMTAALAQTIQAITTDQTAIGALEKTFRGWLTDEEVADELSVLLSPGTDDEPNKALLIARLEACWEPVGLKDHVTQASVVEALAANLEAAIVLESELRDEINIALLKALTFRADEIASSVKDIKDTIEKTREDLVDRLPPRGTDLLASYLKQIRIRCGKLDLSPFDTASADASAGSERLDLTDVYIGMNLKGAGGPPRPRP